MRASQDVPNGGVWRGPFCASDLAVSLNTQYYPSCAGRDQRPCSGGRSSPIIAHSSSVKSPRICSLFSNEKTASRAKKFEKIVCQRSLVDIFAVCLGVINRSIWSSSASQTAWFWVVGLSLVSARRLDLLLFRGSRALLMGSDDRVINHHRFIIMENSLNHTAFVLTAQVSCFLSFLNVEEAHATDSQ